MAETVIELDLSSPWEPPEPPRAPLRFRLRTRWLAALTVLAVVAAGLTAAGAKPRTGPLYQIDDQVRTVMVTGDMLIVGRYQQALSGTRIEGRRLSDGKVLWNVPADLQQMYLTAGDRVLIMIRHSESDRGYTSTLTGLDLATGRQLWTRPRTGLTGTAGGLLVVEDMPDPGKIIEIVEGGELPDPTINHAGDPQPRHVLVLDERTGEPVWELTTPPGTLLDFTRDAQYPAGSVTGVEQLDPTGLVTHRDIRSGAVVATHQLDWSGTPAMFSTGYAWFVAPGAATTRALVYPDGERGGLVFALPGGRRLFRTDVTLYDGFYQCAKDLFCATTEHGIAAYDSSTGRSAWRLDGYTQVMATRGDRLVVGTYEQPDSMPGRLGIADARTGAVTVELTGWRLIDRAPADRILLWRAVDERTAILGELDPATGRIAVFGKAGDWYGPPECSTRGDILACVMVGEATVWHLPPRHPGR
ncbi:PQQ-binding-like beta-propeller repeat protein [Dactylosporangium siamense]|uniref:Pyrrolo-quinoline quinone repeat domain-containing protein n=1 Tax=Dactylosporangium siamense TaxID=685454 RepID=A0A919U694_9ACTN|nr:PQQ-binding-like beta-propeller repeat protein [Dactylosporangium siamense]GIG44199.1 hypothetical protein Dsi01nite_022400 [Dactylosporangium siamense]